MTISPSVSNFINASRWMAALVVVISHARQLSMCDWTYVENKGYIEKAFYFFTQLGHEAVMVFFVISGYLIGGKAIQRLSSGFQPRKYALQRFSRIYAAFLPALFIGATLDLIGRFIFGDSSLYHAGIHIVSLPESSNTSVGIADFIGNLFMLQTVVVAPFGTNGPLWSLAAEWWYYVIFGLSMVILTNKSQSRYVCTGLLLMALYVLPSKLLGLGLMWLVGAGAAVYTQKRLYKPSFIFTIPVAGLWLVIARFSHMAGYEGSYIYRYLVDLGTAIIFASLLVSAHRRMDRPFYPLIHDKLADFSFSLYLVHFPLIVFISAFAAQKGFPILSQPNLYSAMHFLILVSASVLAAYTFSLFTENKTEAFKQAVKPLFYFGQRKSDIL